MSDALIPYAASHFVLDNDGHKTFYRNTFLGSVAGYRWDIWNGEYWTRAPMVIHGNLQPLGSGINQYVIHSFHTPACELTVHALRNAGLPIPDDVPGHLLVKVPSLSGDYSKGHHEKH